MSFKIGHLLYQSIRFILGLFFFLMGLIGIALPWSEFLKTATLQFIVEETLMISLFGLGFALIGLSILVYAILHIRHRYIQIRLGPKAFTIDEDIIHQYLTSYWKEHFPKQYVPSHLMITKESLQIVSDLPFISEEKQMVFLEQVRKDFDDIFGRILGYTHEIHLIVSFQSPNTI